MEKGISEQPNRLELIGGSGAVLEELNSFIRKHGNQRVIDQGKYLRRYPCDAFPKVYHISNRFYDMEKLIPIDWSIQLGEPLAYEILTTLENNIWCHNYEYDENWPDVLSQFLTPELNEWLERIVEYDLFQCLTHGDPTFDNCVRREDQLVILDPVPPRPKMPALRAVDIGKMLQSVFGYHAIVQPKFIGMKTTDDPNKDLSYLKKINQYGAEEMDANLFFCAVHFHSILPYRKNQTNFCRMIEVLRDAIIQAFKDDPYIAGSEKIEIWSQ